MPLHWWYIGNLPIGFWDISLGLLSITTTYCVLKIFHPWIWKQMKKPRKVLYDIMIELCEDKLLVWTLSLLIVLYVILLFKLD